MACDILIFIKLCNFSRIWVSAFNNSAWMRGGEEREEERGREGKEGGGRERGREEKQGITLFFSSKNAKHKG